MNLGKKVKIETVPAQFMEADTITVVSINDDRIQKAITATIRIAENRMGGHTITLWSGDAYDAIGQWTDEQANTRIFDLLTK